MNTEVDRNAQAREQAQLQLRSIISMVTRLDHASEDCEQFDEDGELCAEALEEGIIADAVSVSDYHDADKAREAIQEDALSVEVRSGWQSLSEEFTPTEYRIVLCTGGPHVEIRGELDNCGQPANAFLYYQDWFMSFEMLNTSQVEDAWLLTYAQQFYFGE